MTLAELVTDLERRAAQAEAVGASAPLALTYRAVAAELASLDGHGPGGNEKPGAGADPLITVQEAAGRLGVPVGWLYRRTRTLPFVRKLGPKTLRFDADGLARWAARRAG